MSIANLKRASANLSNQYKATAEADAAKRSYADERYWRPVLDKAGSGSAVIRFLPGIPLTNFDSPNFDTPYIQSLIRIAKEENKDSELLYEPGWVRKWTHGIQGPTDLWYIENNLNSLGTDSVRIADPVSDYNSKLWATKDEALMEQARKQKRKLVYISNIQVIKHAARSEDEGKVFLFNYGKKVHDKILAAMKDDPEEDKVGLPVFDLWRGANFRLKIKKVSNFPNYDDSTFDAPKPLAKSDEELETIYAQAHSLLAEVGKDKFKSYDELEKHLHSILHPKTTLELPQTEAAARPMIEENDEPPFETEGETTGLSAKDFFKKLKGSQTA